MTFDEDGVIEFLNPFFRQIEIEEDTAFGIDRSFGGVQIFGAGFLVGGEGASGKADYFCRFAGYGEHYAISELGVHCGGFGVAAAGFWFFLTCQGVNFPTLSVHRSDG